MMLSFASSTIGFASVPSHADNPMHGNNPCEGMKGTSAINTVAGLDTDANTQAGKLLDVRCFQDSSDVTQVGPQAGADVTPGVIGGMNSATMPALQGDLEDNGLCAVNVHWHEGAEHRSEGEYDETQYGPALGDEGHRRKLGADEQRQGHRCAGFEELDESLKKPFHFKHCEKMHVGETYEVHWPHSAAGSCGTKWQIQSPFYDGVLCNNEAVLGVYGADNTLSNMAQYVGVEAQVFMIVNNEEKQDPKYDLPIDMYGAVKNGPNQWADVAKYTGSTTGTSRDNEICSQYSPVSWHVDRTCQKISAQMFDNLCKAMKANPDDLSGDLYAHGARETVLATLTASNIADDTP